MNIEEITIIEKMTIMLKYNTRIIMNIEEIIIIEKITIMLK